MFDRFWYIAGVAVSIPVSIHDFQITVHVAFAESQSSFDDCSFPVSVAEFHLTSDYWFDVSVAFFFLNIIYGLHTANKCHEMISIWIIN